MLLGGTGNVGLYASLYFSRDPDIDRLVIVGRNEKKGVTVVNNCIVNSIYQDGPEEIEFLKFDLRNDPGLPDKLKEIKPKVAIHLTSAISLYPWFEAQRVQKRKIPLPMTPLMGIASLYKTAKAVKESGVDVKVLNLSLPDIFNVVLDRFGVGPIIGMGPSDLTTQGIRYTVSKDKGVPLDDVDVKMVVARVHRGARNTSYDKIPHYMKVYVKGDDITDDYKTPDLMHKGVDLSGTESLTCPNTTNNALTAASVVQITKAILNDTNEVRNLPGIGGIPGGVPSYIGAKGAEMVLPEGLSYEEAFNICMEGTRLSGIQDFLDDGTVVVTEERLEAQKKFGLNYPKMSVLKAVETEEENIDRLYKHMVKEGIY